MPVGILSTTGPQVKVVFGLVENLPPATGVDPVLLGENPQARLTISYLLDGLPLSYLSSREELIP